MGTPVDKLEPCKCGNAVEIKYIVGMDRRTAARVGNPFAGPTPAYYIHCKNCGENLAVRLKKATVEHRDACKRVLVTNWNERRKKERG